MRAGCTAARTTSPPGALMRDTWLGTWFGTRRGGLAPIDLLLLGALLVGLGMAARRILPTATQPCLDAVGGRLAPLIEWEGGKQTFSFDSADERPPIGVAAIGFGVVGDGASSWFGFDEGQLRLGDRLLSAHRDGKRRVASSVAGWSGQWAATRWPRRGVGTLRACYRNGGAEARTPRTPSRTTPWCRCPHTVGGAWGGPLITSRPDDPLTAGRRCANSCVVGTKHRSTLRVWPGSSAVRLWPLGPPFAPLALALSINPRRGGCAGPCWG